METYDIYLERLTEINVMITQLLHCDDSFVLNNLLTLYATMDDIVFQFCLKPQVNMMLNLLPTDTFKIDYESVLFKSLFDVDTSLVEGVFTGGESDMEISADEIDVIRKNLVSGESVLDISVDPLEYYFTLLCGNIGVDIELFADTLDALKFSNINIENLNELLFDSNLVYKDFISPENVDLWLNTDSINIYYRQDLSAEMITFLDAMVEEIIVKSLIYSADVCLVADIITDDFGLIKSIQIDHDMFLSAFPVNVLKKVFDIIDSDVEISCEASAGIRRYRLLSEMDDLTLAELDNMSLKELDYVVLAD